MIMGDFSARVGNDGGAWSHTTGRFGQEEQNENGMKLLHFCAFNNLVVTNTLFSHRTRHQQTWFHTIESSRSRHMLDYILLNHHFRFSILDTRVCRKTYLQTDHCLVVSRVWLNYKAKWRRAQQEPTPQTDRRLLAEHHVQDFTRVLEEGLIPYTDDSMECL